MTILPEQLKAFLLDFGLLTEAQFAKALEESKKTNKKIGDVLIEQGIIKKDELIKLEAYILGIPFVDLSKETVPQEILQIIPESHANKNNIVAFKKTNSNLEIAMLDPEDFQTIEFLKKGSNFKILPRLTSEESLKHVLKQYQKPLEAEFQDIIGKEEGSFAILPEIKKSLPENDLKKAAEELPIIKIVDTLLKHAILQKASDIHIEPSEKETIIRYRIDGILHDAMILPKQAQTGIVARIKILSNLKIDEHRLPQDGRFKIESDGQKISFRVSILPVYDGEKIVMRILPEGSQGLTLETLGLNHKDLEIIHKDIKKPNGMVLITGPTGSGKTTTLYTIIDILNKPGINISTIEDPIEYRMPRVNQTQVQPKIGLTFANGLRSLVRQDPNIIMVGEIRDNETADLAINAALTGHLVFSTLHTNSAAGALPRLLDMKIEPFLISSTINCIVAQRLVRKLYTETKEKYKLSKSEIKSLSEQFDMKKILTVLRDEKTIAPDAEWEDIFFYRPIGSPDCPDGYKGRIGIYEALKISENIRNLIIQRATSDDLEKRAIEEGMITMLEDGFMKAAQGITSIEEIIRVTKE